MCENGWVTPVPLPQVENFRVLADQCQTEMSRAVRLALWDYKPGAALTASCDKDVEATCPKVRTHQVMLASFQGCF